MTNTVFIEWWIMFIHTFIMLIVNLFYKLNISWSLVKQTICFENIDSNWRYVGYMCLSGCCTTIYFLGNIISEKAFGIGYRVLNLFNK